MAKLVFPSVPAPYRGFVGEVRGWLSRIASYSERSTGSVSVLITQLQTLANKLGASINPTNAVISVRNYLGAVYTPALPGTFKAVAGVTPDQVWLASTILPVQSGTKVLGPAITGSYVNGYTLTIVNGAVTAIVAS